MALNGAGMGPYHYPDSNSTKLQLYTRLTDASFRDVFNDSLGRWNIRRLRWRPKPDLLLTIVHFPSRFHNDRDDQTIESTVLVNDIARVEKMERHQRTILVGDLNMNPFDPGVVAAGTIHGVMARSIASEERVVGGKPYSAFYNPMWGCFGDRTDGPPGTFYLRSSKQVNYYWNVYDQLMLRPGLMHQLERLQVLDSDGHGPLLTPNGLPNLSAASDHLPLYFRLNI